MKRTFKAAAEMIKQRGWAAMPDPTAADAALLEAYRDDIMALMMAENNEPDWDESG